MTNIEFEILVNKFYDGEITQDELRKLDEAKKSNPEFEAIFRSYEKLADEVTNLSDSSEEEIPENLWKQIEVQTKNSSPQIKNISGNYIKYSTPSGKPIQDTLYRRNKSSNWLWVTLTFLFIVFITVIAYKGFQTDMSYNDNSLGMIGFNWKLIDVQGNVTINGKPASQVDALSIGDWIETDELSSATINIPDIGTITLEPGTKIRLVQSDDDKKKIELQYGMLNSDTRASKSNLYINSDKTTAIDFGGVFSFAVDKNGEGLIFVQDGSVKVKSDNRDAIIPTGQFCYVMTNLGPGTPFSKDASKEFRKSLMQYDFYNGGAEAFASAFSSAGFTDAISLVNLIPTVPGNDRVAVFNKISNYVAPPGNIHRDSIKYYKVEELKEWILEIQDHIEKNLQPAMKDLEKNIERSKVNFTLTESGFDKNKFKEEMKEVMKEIKIYTKNITSDVKNTIPSVPKTPKAPAVYSYSYTTIPEFNFNMNEFNEDMKELNLEMKELKKDLYKNAHKDVMIDLRKTEEELEREIEKSDEFEKKILIQVRDKIREQRIKVETDIETDSDD